MSQQTCRGNGAIGGQRVSIDNKVMSSYSDKEIIALAIVLLQDKGLLAASDIASKRLLVDVIASDGSTRRFWRFALGKTPLCIVVAPLTASEVELKESRSAWCIGRHLYAKGCSVPQLFAWHEESGLLVFDDLGDRRLHSVIVPENGTTDRVRVREQYVEVICKLVHMQIEGAVDFESDWCWDGDCYNKELMLERESGYFLSAFWHGLLQHNMPEGILDECQYLAELAAKAPADYFLHRDFQSRNIMIADGVPKFIDFQGGRLGPLGYDLASLLIDPYTALDYAMQEELEDIYISEMSRYVKLDSSVFRKEFHALALQRNLQIIGAFSFLSQVRGKSFFASYLQPALQVAKYRLEQPNFADFPLFKDMIDHGLTCI